MCESVLISKNKGNTILLNQEVIPCPPEAFRVMFYAFVVRGLSLPAHEFLCGLIFLYGLQLHQLLPNSLLHIACFIMLCEYWLGIEPHFGLFKKLYSLKW